MASPYSTKYRIDKKIEHKITPGNILNPPEKKPSANDGGEHRRLRKMSSTIKRIHRRGANYDSSRRCKRNKMKMKEAIEIILANHGDSIEQMLEESNDINAISLAARNLITTCLGGWSCQDNYMISQDNKIRLPANQWSLNEDSTITNKMGVSLNYDWLYDVVQKTDKILCEENQKSIDKNLLADTLSNAASVVRRMSDNNVIKYVISAAKQDGTEDISKLRDVINDTGINWKITGADINGDKIYIHLKVKYSTDGTQKGVVGKNLEIEVRPSDIVREEPSEEELNLEFETGKAESDDNEEQE